MASSRPGERPVQDLVDDPPPPIHLSSAPPLQRQILRACSLSPRGIPMGDSSSKQGRPQGFRTGPPASSISVKRRASDLTRVGAYRTADPQTGPDGSSGGLRPGPVHRLPHSPTVKLGQGRLRPERWVGTTLPAGSALGRRSCTHPALSEADHQPGLKPPARRTRLWSGLGPLAQGRGRRSLRLLEGSVLDLFFLSST